MLNIITVTEGKRGCGYRKPGGLYLRFDGSGRACGRLPLPLRVCPTCGAGIKPTRGWQWIDSAPYIRNNPCRTPEECGGCPMNGDMGKVGLIWVGEAFYPTPEEFIREGDTMGISRRIAAVPRGFVIGETWVWMAHRKTAINPAHPAGPREPAVFRVFRPSRIEYVVRDDDPEDKLQRLVDRGITLVKVVKKEEEKQLM